VADYLALRPHSAVGLVDRAAAAGLVERVPDPERRGKVRVKLTRTGAAQLERLAAVHLDELNVLAPSMESLWRGIHAEVESSP
jgi:DNA-binding MarR family transcriptional regulator